MKKLVIAIIIIILLLLLIAISIFAIYKLNNISNLEKYSWDTKYITIENDVVSLFSPKKSWGEKEVYEKFNNFEYNNNSYYTNNSKILNEYVGNFIKEINLSSHDDDGIEQFIKANIYEIRNISTKCNIAVKFENDYDYYVYTNLYYNSKTLEELVDDLNLKETVSFDSIFYKYSYVDENNETIIEDIEFENIKPNDIWDMLFDDLSIENSYDENNIHYDVITSINCELSILGYSDVSVDLTEDGYMIITILNTSNKFYIGEKKVKTFIEYIIKNYVGYRLIYKYEDENENENSNTIDTDEETTLVITNTNLESQNSSSNIHNVQIIN